MSTIHVAIGNSDDRLPQAQWSAFVDQVDAAVRIHGEPIYGFWVSPSTQPYQNAAWAFQIPNDDHEEKARLRAKLVIIAGQYLQDSIAWNESHTEFLRPGGGTSELPHPQHP